MLQPPGWPRPKGFANGMRARGETVFVGGMIGQDAQGRFAQGFVAQMKLALENIAAVLKEAGATPQHIVRLTWYVRDMDEYLGDLPALGRRLSRGHGPALSRHGGGRGHAAGGAAGAARDRGDGGAAGMMRNRTNGAPRAPWLGLFVTDASK